MKDVEQLLREAPATLPEPDLDPAAIVARGRRGRRRSAFAAMASGVALIVAVVLGLVQLGGPNRTSPPAEPTEPAALPVIVVEPASVGSVMEAGIVGTLEVTADGCVVIGGALPAFPHGTQVGRDSAGVFVDFADGTRIRDGEPVTGVGGGYGDRAYVDSLLPDDLPQACRSLPLVQFRPTAVAAAPLPVLVEDHGEVHMQARIEGVLEVTEDGCVGIRFANDHFTLTAFPPGTTIDQVGDGLAVTFPNGTEVPVGTSVVGGGGGYGNREFAESMLPAELPQACRDLPLAQFYLED
ncbi:hypothetical protein EXU48_02845 [Occultella glacieicola]|uniref:Uncharacterized protein n=1 Tax=Occultella glacieicola TaxID=2518684 RepID=A0ABY2ED79_9MICO|nr:hypothetical protein [Occultella glacieicola]TDE99132.1 hypothetical protein EXU48_02845 [Occultella glacieicola]